jgi:hypothetical protein
VIELSVLNGVSANYRRIRWSGRKRVLLTSQTTATDMLKVLDSMLSEVGPEYGTPAYREGRMRVE